MAEPDRETELTELTERIEPNQTPGPGGKEGKEPWYRAKLSFGVLFRWFVVAALAIGAVLSLYRVATDPAVLREIRQRQRQAQAVRPLPTGAEAARVERLQGALVLARDAVLAYRQTHGYLPDIRSADVMAELWDAGTREAFREATGGGLLALAAATRELDTLRLVGVFGGALSDDQRLRESLAAFSAHSASPPNSADSATRATPSLPPALLRFDGERYEGDEMSVYIALEPE